VAPVQEVAEIAADPQFAWRGAVVEAKHPGRGSFRQVGPVLAGTAPLVEPVVVPDDGVTDTDELLAAAGIPAARLADLRARAVIA
jgi:crotonobetainyl-CoA:carnitine CoA-transferase CaiB-like acyl-CoA transferase